MSRETTSRIMRPRSLVASEAALIILTIIIMAVFLVAVYGPSYLP